MQPSLLAASLGIEIYSIVSCARSVLYIAANEFELLTLETYLKFFVQDVEVIVLPSWNIPPCSLISPTTNVLCQRTHALSRLLSAREESNKPIIVLTSIKGVMQRTMPVDDLLDSIISLNIGNKYDRAELINRLLALSYERADVAENPGEFAVRGGIIDIVFHPFELGYRLDFFGSTLENIKKFHTKTQLSFDKLENLQITPASEIILSQAHITKFKEKYVNIFGSIHSEIYQKISVGSKFHGIDGMLPLFFDDLATIKNYLPTNIEIINNASVKLEIDEFWQEAETNYQAKLNYRGEEGQNYQVLKPEKLYLKPKEVLDFLNASREHQIKEVWHHNHKLVSILQASENKLNSIKQYWQENGHKVVIACNSRENFNTLAKLLQIDSIQQIRNHQEVLNLHPGSICALETRIKDGFETKDYILLSEQEIFKQRPEAVVNKAKKVKNYTKFMYEVNSLQVGELVTHREYGIGKFNGIVPLTILGAVHDFIEISYAGSDKLYLPVENLELISRYGEEQSGIQLDKLGGTAWKFRKAKLKERIKLAAETLIQTAALREAQAGAILSPLPELYDLFCQKFPFVETTDQQNAIDEVLEDMASGKSMDRLICGDVGFGKTEVALRAACAAVLSDTGKSQVAIIVPTTLLARQHYATFKERFKDLPIFVQQLSKFTPRSELKSVKENIFTGKIDIIIGTHSLLAKDIKFNNLGLLIIDEEQHFGVAQKEKLKDLKANVHVLSLSATPIPRTLQTALLDIKSLSLITTPPADKKPINTFFSVYDPIQIKNAIISEKNRGGRTFYVTPRITYLQEISFALSKLAPEIRVTIAHGGMSSTALDKALNDFYEGRYDVLLSTSIVESGLDIPIANTLIVDRAHMFGLSQLYQIRGRIGRSKAQGYAYLTIPNTSSITPNAKKRLTLLQSINTLGAGFSIASYDLDIRGYGNLLGEEQSGHIKEVGIELYHAMLEEAVNNLKGKEINQTQDWSPVINLGISVQIPEHYISCSSLRLSMYRRIADITTQIEADEFANNMVDRFGPLPEEAKHLFSIIKLKQMAKSIGISKIDIGENGLAVSFYKNQATNPNAVLKLVRENRSTKLKPDGKLIFFLNWNGKDKVDTTMNLLTQLLDSVKEI